MEKNLKLEANLYSRIDVLKGHVEREKCRSVIICLYRLNKFILSNQSYFVQVAPDKLSIAIQIIEIVNAWISQYLTKRSVNSVTVKDAEEVKSLLPENRRTSLN